MLWMLRVPVETAELLLSLLRLSRRYAVIADILPRPFRFLLALGNRRGSFPFLPFLIVLRPASFLVSLLAQSLGLEFVPVSLDACEPAVR